VRKLALGKLDWAKDRRPLQSTYLASLPSSKTFVTVKIAHKAHMATIVSKTYSKKLNYRQ